MNTSSASNCPPLGERGSRNAEKGAGDFPTSASVSAGFPVPTSATDRGAQLSSTLRRAFGRSIFCGPAFQKVRPFFDARGDVNAVVLKRTQSEIISARACSRVSTGVLPSSIECDGPYTHEVGLNATTDRQVRWIDTDVHMQTHGADVFFKIKELGLDR